MAVRRQRAATNLRISFRRFWAVAAIARRDRPADNIASKGDAAALSFDPSLRLRFFTLRRVKINESRPQRSNDGRKPAANPAKQSAVALVAQKSQSAGRHGRFPLKRQ